MQPVPLLHVACPTWLPPHLGSSRSRSQAFLPLLTFFDLLSIIPLPRRHQLAQQRLPSLVEAGAGSLHPHWGWRAAALKGWVPKCLPAKLLAPQLHGITSSHPGTEWHTRFLLAQLSRMCPGALAIWAERPSRSQAHAALMPCHAMHRSTAALYACAFQNGAPIAQHACAPASSPDPHLPALPAVQPPPPRQTAERSTACTAPLRCAGRPPALIHGRAFIRLLALQRQTTADAGRQAGSHHFFPAHPPQTLAGITAHQPSKKTVAHAGVPARSPPQTSAGSPAPRPAL